MSLFRTVPTLLYCDTNSYYVKHYEDNAPKTIFCDNLTMKRIDRTDLKVR